MCSVPLGSTVPGLSLTCGWVCAASQESGCSCPIPHRTCLVCSLSTTTKFLYSRVDKSTLPINWGLEPTGSFVGGAASGLSGRYVTSAAPAETPTSTPSVIYSGGSLESPLIMIAQLYHTLLSVCVLTTCRATLSCRPKGDFYEEVPFPRLRAIGLGLLIQSPFGPEIR